VIRTWFKLDPRPLFSLVVRPEIKSTSDLKGKVFAVNAFGFSQAILTEGSSSTYGIEKRRVQAYRRGRNGRPFGNDGKEFGLRNPRATARERQDGKSGLSIDGEYGGHHCVSHYWTSDTRK
jgi:hypothetical protein